MKQTAQQHVAQHKDRSIKSVGIEIMQDNFSFHRNMINLLNIPHEKNVTKNVNTQICIKSYNCHNFVCRFNLTREYRKVQGQKCVGSTCLTFRIHASEVLIQESEKYVKKLQVY